MSNGRLFGNNPVVRQFARERSQLEQIAENSSRLAHAWLTFTTVGSGEYAPPDPQRFGCTFTERPDITTGFEVDVAAQDLVPNRFPRVSAGVRGWVRDVNNFYIGAYVFFAIDTTGFDSLDPKLNITTPPQYTLHHTFMFSGTAAKALPADWLAHSGVVT